MSDRNTQNLDQWSPSETAAPAPAQASTAAPAPAVKQELVELNYPEPTLLSVVVRDVARWSGQSFVMEPSVNTKIQIFAPRKLSIPEAYELFLASLSIVNLRAVQIGKIVKIVAITLVIAA